MKIMRYIKNKNLNEVDSRLVCFKNIIVNNIWIKSAMDIFCDNNNLILIMNLKFSKCAYFI